MRKFSAVKIQLDSLSESTRLQKEQLLSLGYLLARLNSNEDNLIFGSNSAFNSSQQCNQNKLYKQLTYIRNVRKKNHF